MMGNDIQKNVRITKKHGPKVSVVIPVFNVENALERCLNSICKQTFTDIEIICIDDCSTDGSWNIILDHSKKDNRFRILRHEINKSANICRKEGALLAKGEYILFVDPDDSLEKDALNIAYNCAVQNDVEIVHFGTNVINAGVTQKQIEWYEKFACPYEGVIHGDDVFIKCFVEEKYRFNIWNKLIRSSLCQKAMKECVDEYLPKAQDLYAWFLIAFYAKSYIGIANKLYNYYFGGGVSGGRTFTEDKFTRHCSQANVMYYIILFLIKNGALHKYSVAVERIANNLINDNVASLKACGKAKVSFGAEKVFANAWIEGMLQTKLFEYLSHNQDLECAKILFGINFKILKNVSVRLRLLLYDNFKKIINIFPCVIDGFQEKLDRQSKDYMFVQTIVCAERMAHYGDKYVPIFFATNNNYVPFLGVTLNSIVASANKNYFYDIYVLHSGIDNYYVEKLSGELSKNVHITCVNVKAIVTSQTLYSNRHYSVEMYHRFLIPELFFFVNKALYLDCDIIVLSSIHELYGIDIGNNTIGAARNLLHHEMRDYVVKKLHGSPEKYFNSGVMLIDCNKFNIQQIKLKCYDYLKGHKDLSCPDQDALNMCCKNVFLIDVTWNFQWHHTLNISQQPKFNLIDGDKELFQEAQVTPRIIHFTSNKKPWNYLRSDYSDMFWNYVKGSIFEREVEFKFRALDDPINVKIKDLYIQVGAIKKKIAPEKKQIGGILLWPIKKLRSFIRCWKENGFVFTMVRLFGGKKKAQKYREKH